MKRILFLALLGVAFAPAQPAKFDAIIRNGTILDGSGNPRAIVRSRSPWTSAPPTTVIVKIEGQDEWLTFPVTATIRGQ